ncbi:hypothetical protein KIPB_003935 [Kipferlia bialata]|uniref:DNA2/NAM7 helicase-like C-terminal domain-containing protein n=1 Tax=Kipferlia bialata TaxID=797122 RepID=A0A9K3CTP7_9EUKA|nr:hypothetical protein KIPB_003935 [Kipferlia bialata]|eukprot:g3935.t1
MSSYSPLSLSGPYTQADRERDRERDVMRDIENGVVPNRVGERDFRSTAPLSASHSLSLAKPIGSLSGSFGAPKQQPLYDMEEEALRAQIAIKFEASCSFDLPIAYEKGTLTFWPTDACLRAQFAAIETAEAHHLETRLVPGREEEEDEGDIDDTDCAIPMSKSMKQERVIAVGGGFDDFSDDSDDESTTSEDDCMDDDWDIMGGQGDQDMSSRVTVPRHHLLSALPDTHQPNPAQTQAILGCLSATSKGRPFVIYGPPGTGKSYTIACLAAVLLAKGNAVLLTAPTNTAADLLATMLLSVEPTLRKSMLRVAGQSRAPRDAPASIRDIMPIDHDGQCIIPSDITAYKCIVTTCATAGNLCLIQAPKFSHVIVDEASSGIEADVLCALAAQPNAAYVVSGDPRQLGPVVRNKANMHRLGYGISMLQRLTSGNAREGRHYVMLTQNYRNHPAIMTPSNTMFYGDRLESRCKERVTYLEDCPVLPRKGFPLCFHSVPGKAEQDPVTKSWTNQEEINRVIDLAKSLLSGVWSVAQHELAIVTPYRKQSHFLRQALRRNEMEGVKVGSVETMQGQEFDAVIISTVRTYNGSDHMRSTLGFVADARRLNVIVTRARSLVAICGDPCALSLCPYWRGLLKYIDMHGGASGPGLGCLRGVPVHEAHAQGRGDKTNANKGGRRGNGRGKGKQAPKAQPERYPVGGQPRERDTRERETRQAQAPQPRRGQKKGMLFQM